MNRLPQLVLEHIFEYLNVQDLCSTRLVCCHWNQMFLWKMEFSNSNFIKSLHYVPLETDEQMELFLSTFGRAEVPIPFQRFLWNVNAGTDAQVNAFATLYENCIVELCISDSNSDDLLEWNDDPLQSHIGMEEGLERIRTLLHKVGHSLEVLQINVFSSFRWSGEPPPEGISVPLLPRLSILDAKCGGIFEWVKALVKNAPVLEFITIERWHIRDAMLRDFGANLQDLDYDPERSKIQEYSKRWFDANARRLQLEFGAWDFSRLDDEPYQRILKDQSKNMVAIDALAPPHDALLGVFPRVRALGTLSVTWLENPLKVFSPTKLPQLKRVYVHDSTVTAQDFPVELSCVYPNVVHFFLRVHTNPERTYTPLPYYKLFPNVTKLELDSEVTRNLIGLFNHFEHVRCLVMSYGRRFYNSHEEHDFELECGAKPHVVSFNKLERLEYRGMNGSEEVFSTLVSSAKSSFLTSLKGARFWHLIRTYPFTDDQDMSTQLNAEEFRNEVKKREIQNVEQLQQYCKVDWWITVADDDEKVV